MTDYDIWFSTLKLSNKIKLDLIKEYKNTENIWENCKLDKIKNSWNNNLIKDIKNIINSNNIKMVHYNDILYPNKLKEIENAPTTLFYKGDISRLNEEYNVSIVGSRNSTNYGLNVTKILSCELTKNNINIISGMARGIDSCAQNTCINNKGYTCAILGCGLDIIYPKENKELYNQIAYSGCLISEYLPGTPPLSINFPIRNRIISGLSDIVIIVEAGIKSGSLITASMALEQGKDVMAVPGSIFSEQSKGCNKLIRDGAYPVTCIEDVFRILNIDYKSTKKKKIQKFTKEQEKICSVLSDEPIHIDDILKITDIDINHLYEVLFELQLKEEIICLAGSYYVKNQQNI
ncbi:DNA processing protein [Clostridium sp. USBA 49]|jgi:DNA processing protein|uniref:DNA-processing protein DprA n=1 Tax=Clostridium TaxID=1485 RepID=UPI00099A2E84|nr:MULTISPECIES: DNA-processing protein DprA [Clostridium]SKA76418.1 DNA processing protein [Clostridium sp. USBA 49]